MNYWINTVSRDHVQRGVAGGFTQAGHGKPTGLKKLKQGDWIIFYSPKTAYEGSEPLQAFTAIGQVADDELYQFQMTPDFNPWRRNVDFKPCQEALIKPLINDLSFITDKTHWGYKFRFGLFQIPEADFKMIHEAMLGEAEPTGAVMAVIEMAETLMYAENRVTHVSHTSSVDAKMTTVTRAFSYHELEKVSTGLLRPIAEIALQIRHQRFRDVPRDVYDIDTAWSLVEAAGPEKLKEQSVPAYMTRFSIEAYPNGPTHITLEEPAVLTRGREIRIATPYDLQVLFDNLGVLHDLHLAEHVDNIRAAEASS